MMQASPRLALPIKCVVDAEGKLMAADAAVRRLHFGNGGVEGGTIAVPGLLELASLCWRTGLKFERTVHVADKEHDLELWVEAEKRENLVNLSIIGWQERASAPRASSPIRSPELGITQRTNLPVMYLNGTGLILRADPALLGIFSTDCIATPFVQHFRLIDEAVDIAALLRTNDIPGRAKIEHIGSQTRHDVLVDAIKSDDDHLLGARLVFLTDEAEASKAEVEEAPSAPVHPGLGLGRHFATAVRQPLGRILANAETIGSELNGPILEQYSSYAKDIASAARHLAELVSDLEDLDAIDKPDFKVAQEPVEFGDIAKRVAGLLALKAADHQIELSVPDAEIRCHAMGEFRRVLQIVLNLVGNAIRYSPGGSTVTIVIDPSDCSISVIDQGAGVAEEDRERIFTKFERLGRSGDGGSGLGLYISRKLARAMRGDLTVTVADGGGAKFTLRLPSANN